MVQQYMKSGTMLALVVESKKGPEPWTDPVRAMPAKNSVAAEPPRILNLRAAQMMKGKGSSSRG